jgi:hypothetical protein
MAVSLRNPPPVVAEVLHMVGCDSVICMEQSPAA